MAIIAKKTILDYLKSGQIVISPFSGEQLGPNGYDLHLGKNLYCYEGNFIDTKLDVSGNYRPLVIPPQGLIIHPDIIYLGVTVEYTEAHGLVPVMEGKSSLGRMGMESHICAGFGDDGFCGHWTLEIRVTVPTRIYAGMPIGQIIWHQSFGSEASSSYIRTGSYNNHISDDPKPVLPNLWKKEHQFIEVHTRNEN